MGYRVGIGFDAHRLTEGRALVLGGIPIPHERGLEGHSDGDVLLHAVTDAILGAVGAPDIGSLFPSHDPRFQGTSSRLFVERAVAVAAERGFRLAQLDTVILAEEPRLAERYAALRHSLAEIAGLSEDAVSVKATTCDGMGFIGRGEGIAAQAVVLVERIEPREDL